MNLGPDAHSDVETGLNPEFQKTFLDVCSVFMTHTLSCLVLEVQLTLPLKHLVLHYLINSLSK